MHTHTYAHAFPANNKCSHWINFCICFPSFWTNERLFLQALFPFFFTSPIFFSFFGLFPQGSQTSSFHFRSIVESRSVLPKVLILTPQPLPLPLPALKCVPSTSAHSSGSSPAFTMILYSMECCYSKASLTSLRISLISYPRFWSHQL